jgi:hypothetical protein
MFQKTLKKQMRYEVLTRISHQGVSPG